MSDDGTAFYRQLTEAHLKIAEAYPKTVMLLSGASLTLSITFWEKFVGSDAARAVWALRAGWFLLAASVLMILLAMLLSLGSLERAIENYDQYMAGKYPQQRRRWWIQFLNIVAAGTLTAGLLALVGFASYNVREGETLNDKAKPTAEIRKDSFVIPSRPPMQQQQQLPVAPPAPAPAPVPAASPGTNKGK
jgi:hypothetical protein